LQVFKVAQVKVIIIKVAPLSNFRGNSMGNIVDNKNKETTEIFKNKGV
jgi:hypothetical protein